MNRRSVLAFLVLAGSQLACGNAGEDLGFGVRRAPPMTALVYFDRDGSGTYATPGDTTVAGLLVRLIQVGVPEPLQSGTTAANGTVVFSNLDPGFYAAVVDSQVLGDSIVATRSPFTMRVVAGGQPTTMEVGLAPPLVTVQAFRASLPGRIFLVGGVIHAGRHQYTDRASYLSDSTGALRLQNVRNLNNNPENVPGDVVRVRGKVAVFNGQAVLDSAVVYLVTPGPEGAPDTLTTGEAVTAQGGLQDAALVRVEGATILDTATVGAVFRVGVNDGSGRLEIQLDPLGFPTTSLFVPGSLIDATGVLVPLTPGVWQLWPRNRDDYVIR